MQSAENLPLPVSVQYNLSDLRAVSLVVWRRWVKIGLLIALVIVGLNVGIPVVGGAQLSDAIGLIDWPSLLLIPIIVLMMLLLTPIFAMRARRKNKWDIPLSYVATPDLLSIEHAQGKTETLWAAFRTVEVRRDRLFLFTSPACAFILHRRFFADEPSFQTWIAYTQRAISNAKSVTPE